MAIKELGIDVTQVDDTPQHELGAEVLEIRGGAGTLTRIYNTNGIGITGTSETTRYDANKRYRYVRADAAIPQYDCVSKKLAETDDPYAYVKTPDAVAFGEGIAEVAIGADKYGWITIHGYVLTASVADAVVAGDFVAPSATAGRLDAFTFTTTAATLTQLLAGFKAGVAGIQAITDGNASNQASVFIHGG